jgi:hypothetical protein
MTTQTYYYKKKRGSLVDVICDELTYGETVYIWSDTLNKYIPTEAPSLLISEYNVATNWDDDGNNYIEAQVESAEVQEKVVELAKKFGKRFSTNYSKYAGAGREYQVKIYIEEEDFDGNYFDPNVIVRGSVKH